MNPVVEVLINNKTIGRFHDFGPVREVLPKVLDAALRAWTAPPPPAVGKPLGEEQIEKLREETFSTNNPFCPVDSKSMRKAVRAAERAHGIVTKESDP